MQICRNITINTIQKQTVKAHLHKRNRIMMDKAKMRSNNDMCGINEMPNE
ncbi:hypothetical protein T05_6301 [Trichinella murrelli]|uniref:Uncharacterized protein n=1 Tax=Trichinella murrelli TaxID=144512 RepID=A0A0V0SZJ9_9BILA|nr:hypothetical protein T05_6301 [Trichinella murrelli]